MRTVPRIKDRIPLKAELVDDGRHITLYVHVGPDETGMVDFSADLHPVAAIADIRQARVTGVEIILSREKDEDSPVSRVAQKRIRELEREVEVLETQVRRLKGKP